VHWKDLFSPLFCRDVSQMGCNESPFLGDVYVLYKIIYKLDQNFFSLCYLINGTFIRVLVYPGREKAM
jgi:hypothetical protein